MKELDAMAEIIDGLSPEQCREYCRALLRFSKRATACNVNPPSYFDMKLCLGAAVDDLQSDLDDLLGQLSKSYCNVCGEFIPYNHACLINGETGECVCCTCEGAINK